MKYIVDLDRPPAPSIEQFERDYDNLLTVEVLDEHAKNISARARVMLVFTKNGLIGFATELLRLANAWQEGSHRHVRPIQEGEPVVQSIGVYLTPSSSETIINLASSSLNAKELSRKE